MDSVDWGSIFSSAVQAYSSYNSNSKPSAQQSNSNSSMSSTQTQQSLMDQFNSMDTSQQTDSQLASTLQQISNLNNSSGSSTNIGQDKNAGTDAGSGSTWDNIKNYFNNPSQYGGSTGKYLFGQNDANKNGGSGDYVQEATDAIKKYIPSIIIVLVGIILLIGAFLMYRK